MKIYSYINTYGRTETLLPLTILSIINQTVKPTSLTIWDENKDFKNPLENPTLKYLLDLCMEKGIQWHWLRGDCKGAHHNHEKMNSRDDCDYLWFLDDDQVCESNCLEKLLEGMKEDVGAVAGLILKTPTQKLPIGIDGKLNDIYKGQNIQWYKWGGEPKECEHLYSSFLYRPNIVHFDTRFSKKSFRAETQFTHSLFLKGYKLIVTPNAVTWHFESDGGCRSTEQEKTNMEMYNSDNQIFSQWLSFKNYGKNLVVLNSGKGDHYMALQAGIVTPGSVVASCYPECFEGLDVELISIAQAEQIVDTKDYDIYKWCHANNWSGTLIEAYEAFYKHINQKYEKNSNI